MLKENRRNKEIGKELVQVLQLFTFQIILTCFYPIIQLLDFVDWYREFIFISETKSKVVKSLDFGSRFPVHNLSFVSLKPWDFPQVLWASVSPSWKGDDTITYLTGLCGGSLVKRGEGLGQAHMYKVPDKL